MGEPYGRLWQFLLDTYGPLDGARVLARVLGAINQQGAEVVGKARARATTSSLVKSAILTSYWKGLATFAQASG